MRQRIREIGIRRSFGATGGRVFFAVMLESVVATFVAGIIGIVAGRRAHAAGLHRAVARAGHQRRARPSRSARADLGLIAAVAVGAVAGLIPAIVAVRIRPIDAIRY